jgi:mannose-6-phosphate isomerase-like protein (cupin superfamily)
VWLFLARPVAHDSGRKVRRAEGENVEAKAEMQERGFVRLGPGEGKSLWVLGGLVTLKVASERTGGAYSLFETVTQPGKGVPPHVHHREDESFYVLEGEFEFSDGERPVRAGPGTFVYVSRGNFHDFTNVGDALGRMLNSQTPGGLYERFFEEIGEEVQDPDGSPDIERVTRIAARYGTEFPPPPRLATLRKTGFRKGA